MYADNSECLKWCIFKYTSQQHSDIFLVAGKISVSKFVLGIYPHLTKDVLRGQCFYYRRYYIRPSEGFFTCSTRMSSIPANLTLVISSSINSSEATIISTSRIHSWKKVHVPTLSSELGERYMRQDWQRDWWMRWRDIITSGLSNVRWTDSGS